MDFVEKNYASLAVVNANAAITSEIKAESDGEKRIEHQDSFCL